MTFDVTSSGAVVRRGGFDSVALELALDELDLRARELIQRLEVFVAGDPRVGDDQDPVPHVIEREHRVEQHEAGLFVRSSVVGCSVTGSNQAAAS